MAIRSEGRLMATAIRILYVNNESEILDNGKQFLERSGDFTVTTALSTREAIRLLEQEIFDVIISDYQMPGIDDLHFLVAVQTRFGQVPFILFTVKDMEEGVINAIKNKANFYLKKNGEPGAHFAELPDRIKQAASRKSGDDALKESKKKYQQLIEHTNEAIVIVQNGMLKFVNHQTVKSTGYSEHELLSMTFPGLIHPEDRAMVMERYHNRLKGEELPARYCFRISPKDGSIRWVENSVVTVDWEGHPATLNLLTDITERKQVEEALKESEEKYRTLVEKANEAIIIVQEGIFVFVNHRTSELLGVPIGDLKGRPFIDFVWPEDRELVIANYHKRITGEIIRDNYDFRIVSAGGRVFWIFLSAAIIQWNGKSATLGLLTDITERKQAEEALQTLTQELETRILQSTTELEREIVERKASDATLMSSLNEKEILLREIHHRVKNNLQIITSLLRLQKQQIIDPNTIEVLQDSETRIRSMALVHEKLYRSTNLSSIDFSEYTQTLATSLINAYAADPDRIRLVIDIKDVSLDINRAIPAGLIMNELVANALKHAFPNGQSGQINIRGRNTPAGIAISVQDNGVGLPDKLDWKNTSTLGLHLVTTLIRQLEGSIELNRSGGTTFEMIIPPANEEISQ